MSILGVGNLSRTNTQEDVLAKLYKPLNYYEIYPARADSAY